jgi:hypothetical protein
MHRNKKLEKVHELKHMTKALGEHVYISII